MRRPHDKNRNREVGRDFSPIELRLIVWAGLLTQIGRRFKMEPEDAALMLDLDMAVVLRQFPWMNGPSGLFPAAETGG